MGTPDHLTCLLRNVYGGQKGTVRTGHGTTDWFHIGKGVLSPCLFNHKLESRLQGISTSSDTQMKVKVSVTQLCPIFCDSMDSSLQIPLSMEFSRQEYWSG